MQFKKSFLAALASVALVACGGGGDDDARYDALVSFGDSLSDVGSYKTAGIARLGGGKYTVNGPDSLVWVEQIAAKLDLPTPCAAQTGLQSSGRFAQFAGAVENHPNCTAYGQGGSRVSNPAGPWNMRSLAVGDARGELGQLTVPVTTQIENHLKTRNDSFSGKELVLVLAGSNDVFVHTEEVARRLITPDQAGIAMATAGAQLAGLVQTQILGKGAKKVVVLNLPNISNTPATLAAERQQPGSKQLVDAITQAFNAQLAVLATTPGVMLVDLYTQNTDHSANPVKYGLSNVTTPACNNSFPDAPDFPAPSLVCTTATTIAGDTSRYLFADDVHPTPYGHSLLRDMTLVAMDKAGW